MVNNLDKSTLSSFEKKSRFFDTFAYRYFGWVVEKRIDRFEDLKRQLRRAGVEKSLRMFLSVTIFESILTMLFVTGFGVLAWFFVNVSAPQISFPIVFPILFGIISAFVTYSVIIFNVSLKVNTRKRKIEASLPTAASYMTAMASAGVTPDKIFLSLAQDEMDLYLKEDAKIIARDVEIFNQDIIRAIENASKRSPSPKYSAFLEGIVSTFTSGGDLQSYLQNTSKTLMNDKLQIEKGFIESLGLMAELFLVMCIVTPTFIVVMIAMVAMQGTINHDALSGIVLALAFIVIPMLQGIIIILVDGLQPEE